MDHGLNLGHIPFPSSHTSYTPPEKRRAAETASAAVDPRRVRAARAPVAKPPTGTDRRSPAAQLSILPDDIAPADVRFLLGATNERIGGSVAASAVSHVFGIALIALLISLAPERVYEPVAGDRMNYNIIWMPQDGPGGGGGGGGNESLELPAEVQLEGPDEAELSVPVEEPPDYIEPDVEPEAEPLDTQNLTIPALSMASAVKTRAGVLEGLMAASTLSQGSGRDGAGSGDGGGIGSGQGDGLGPGQGGGVGGGVYRPGAGIEMPRPVYRAEPRYTSEAMRAKVTGKVLLEAVVQPDGTVGAVTITKSLDPVFGLDEQAIACAKEWRFVPGTRFGEPVAVLVVMEISFNLR